MLHGEVLQVAVVYQKIPRGDRNAMIHYNKSTREALELSIPETTCPRSFAYHAR